MSLRMARRQEREARDAQRIRGAVDRAQRSSAATLERNQRRAAASGDRAWRAELRHVNRNARAEIARDNRAMRSAREEHDFRARTANQMLIAYGRQQSAAARARQAEGSRRSSRMVGGLNLAGGAAMGGILGAIGITRATLGGAMAFAEMAASAAQLTLSIGESVLQMIAFRESALTTLRAMSGGSNEVASEQYRFAQRFAMQTPLDTAQVLQLQSQVSTAGFRGQQNREILMGAADVGAANPNDATAGSRYVRALGQIRNAGRLRAQEMNQLGEVGVGRRELLLSLGRQGGVRRGANENDDAYAARLQRMQESGRFTGDQGVAAAQDVVRRQWSGGELGGFARSQGETLLGTLSNLRGSVMTLFTTIENIENLPGITTLKTGLNAIAMTLSGVTPQGQRLQRIISSIVDEVSMFVGLGIGDFETTFSGILDTAEQFMPVARVLVTAFAETGIAEFRRQFGGLGGDMRAFFADGDMVNEVRDLARGLVSFARIGVSVTRWTLTAAGMILQLVGSVHQLVGEMSTVQQLTTLFGLLTNPFQTLMGLSAQAGIADATRGIGTQAVDGIRAGILQQRPLLDADVRAMAQSIPTTSQDALAIRSPSRLMADAVGRYIPEGIALGIDRGRGPLDEAMGSLVGPGDVGAAGGLGGMGRGLSIENLTIQVGAGATEETGRDVARGFLDELVALLEVPALAG